MIALVAAALLSTPTGVHSLADVKRLVADGTPASTVVDELKASGIAFSVTPREAIELYCAGIPGEVLSAILETSGEAYPAVSVRDGQIELLFPSYRLVGRPGESGPVITVSGFAADGSRLAPPVEPRQEAVDRPQLPAPPRAFAAPVAAAGTTVEPVERPATPSPAAPAYGTHIVFSSGYSLLHPVGDGYPSGSVGGHPPHHPPVGSSGSGCPGDRGCDCDAGLAPPAALPPQRPAAQARSSRWPSEKLTFGFGPQTPLKPLGSR